jgi:hypothetical protein
MQEENGEPCKGETGLSLASPKDTFHHKASDIPAISPDILLESSFFDDVLSVFEYIVVWARPVNSG